MIYNWVKDAFWKEEQTIELEENEFESHVKAHDNWSNVTNSLKSKIKSGGLKKTLSMVPKADNGAIDEIAPMRR